MVTNSFFFFQKNVVSCEVDLELPTSHKRKYFNKEHKEQLKATDS